jgi:hypothetical protein
MKKTHLIFNKTSIFADQVCCDPFDVEMPEPELYEHTFFLSPGVRLLETSTQEVHVSPCRSCLWCILSPTTSPNLDEALKILWLQHAVAPHEDEPWLRYWQGQQAIQSLGRRILSLINRMKVYLFNMHALPLRQRSASNARSACSMSSCERGSLPAPHGISCRDA